MSQWKIIHNPRCSKSRQALALLEQAGVKPEVIEYLKFPLNPEELKDLISKLQGAQAKDLVRTKEERYKELQFDLDSEAVIINFLSKYPQLLERPIVIKDNVALIGRPPEKIQSLLS